MACLDCVTATTGAGYRRRRAGVIWVGDLNGDVGHENWSLPEPMIPGAAYRGAPMTLGIHAEKSDRLHWAGKPRESTKTSICARESAHTIEAYPQRYARVAGALYLVIIVLGAFAEGFVTNKLLVPGDPAATAHNILGSPALWRLSGAGDLIVALCAVPLLWIEYLLLRPVSKQLVVLAVLFNLVSLAVEAISKLFLLVVVPTLESATHLTAFEPQQLQVLANLALQSHDIAFNIALIFFGCTCLVNGYLIFKSGYVPKLIGVLMQVAGVSYLIACFAALFAPAFADLIIPAILVLPLIGESSFCLWLLVKGVDVTKWKQQLANRGTWDLNVDRDRLGERARTSAT